jgi:hypothetical protein
MYKKHLKKAKNNAAILKDEEKVKALVKLEEDSGKIFAKSQIEQWLVNDNVHYNRWETFSKEDFLPMISAYKDLFSLFSCSKCGSLIAFNEISGQNRQV